MVVFIEGRNIGLFISQTRIGFPLIKVIISNYIGLCKSLQHYRVFLIDSMIVFIKGWNICLFKGQTGIGFPLMEILDQLLTFYHKAIEVYSYIILFNCAKFEASYIYLTIKFIEGQNIGLFISQTRIGFPLIETFHHKVINVFLY
jgi:hypothetical protein